MACSEPFAGGSAHFVCAQCESRRFSFDYSVSAFRFRGLVREIIHRIKYGQEYWLRRQAASWLFEAFRDSRLTRPAPDLLIPVPLHPVRLRERGFNQSDAIAEIVASRLQLSCKPVLQRVRQTESQTGFDRAQRISNLRGAFIVREHAPVHDLHCVVVDDVFTTGSTLDACARALLSAGAASVRCATVARG